MDTETERDAGWIPCRRCKGTGTYSWEAGKSGPCFLCEGTGDGRIQNRTGFGPRRGGWRRNGGSSSSTTTHESSQDESQDESAGNDAATVPVPTAAHLTAAEHLAAALAGLSQSAPMDADAVRQILASEMQGSINKLERLIESAVSTRAMLTEAIAGIPRRLVITVGDHMGELPAVRHCQLEHVLQLIAIGEEVCAVGPAGAGKTTGGEQIAEALGLTFYLQGAITGSHELLGFVDAYGKYHTTPFRQAFEHGGLLMLDEMDRGDASAPLVAQAALANGVMTFPDSPTPVRRHDSFRVICCANTWGHGADRQYVGATQLDAAWLDRFAFVAWDYDESLERQIAGNDEWCSFVQSVRHAVFKNSIRAIVSPRASLKGAKQLAAGIARDKVESALIWKGMSDADQARVQEAL